MGDSQEAAKGAGRGLFHGSSSPIDLLAAPRRLGDEQTATQIETNKQACQNHNPTNPVPRKGLSSRRPFPWQANKKAMQKGL
jgi:hypothetical protein